MGLERLGSGAKRLVLDRSASGLEGCFKLGGRTGFVVIASSCVLHTSATSATHENARAKL